MTGREQLWYALELLPDDIIEEAAAYVPKNTHRSRRLLLAVVVAAAFLLLGCIAHTWLYAPGRGIIPAFADTGVQVWFTDERVLLGDTVLEAALLAEDPEEPEKNRIMIWMYAEDQKSLENWPKVQVNGILYQFRHYRMSRNSQVCCYTYVPDKNAAVGPVQDPAEGTILSLQSLVRDEDGNVQTGAPAGEAVRIPLQEAVGGTVQQILLDGERYVAFLPMTVNVFAGNFHCPGLTFPENVWNVQAKGSFTLRYTDGAKTELTGILSMDGLQKYETGVVTDRYDCPLETAVLHSMTVYLDCEPRFSDAVPEPLYSFPLMEPGGTHFCDIPVWNKNGLEIRLVSLYRAETGILCETEFRDESGDILLMGAEAGFTFRAEPPDGEKISAFSDLFSPDPATGEMITRDGRILQTEDTIHMYLSSVSWTYANPDGSPLGEIRFDGKG